MKIKNRSANLVVYSIDDLKVYRRFAPGEVKDVTMEEIQKLLYQPGGTALFKKYLQVSSADMEALGFEEQEPEYHYSEDMIKNIILNGTLDEFLDFLDFAPEGAISIAKDLAIKLPMNDMNKAEGMKKATGFDVLKAIGHTKAVEKDLQGEDTKTLEIRQRRTQPKIENTTITSKYKVIED